MHAVRTLLALIALAAPAHAAEGGLDTERGNSQGAGSPSGPVAVSGDALSSLDFVGAPDGAEVVMGLPPGVSPAASQSGSRVTVSLPGVTVPASLQRPLDASYFAAPVLTVKASPGATGGAVAVELREGATWELLPGEGGYWRLATRFGHHGVVYQAEDPVVIDSRYIRGGGGGVGDAALQSSLITGQNDGQLFRDAMGYSGAAAAGPAEGPRMNIDLVESDIHNVLRLIGQTANLNIVADDSVQGTVTVNLHDVTWRDALSAILLAEGLTASIDGGTMVVAPLGSR